MRTRRQFLSEVGGGMLTASVGASLAAELGWSPAWADAPDERLRFGALEPLVALMQETPPDRLLPLLVERLHEGTDLKTLIAAGALANARTFGGEDYIGFHTFMALAPAHAMARRLPEAERPLPVLKVLYRNASRIQAHGGPSSEVLRPVTPEPANATPPGGEALRAQVRRREALAAERLFAAQVAYSPGEAFQHLQYEVEDEVDVHRVVLAWRAWSSLDFVGAEHAHTLLRQSVRYCLKAEQNLHEKNRPVSPIREQLPRLLDEYRLHDRPAGTRQVDDAWIERMARLIYGGTRAAAADAVAAAFAEGIDPAAVSDALAVASNLLLLHDPGRPAQWAQAEKPVGSVHGDSVGVHASDAANAWRNIARASNPRNAAASLIVGAFHTAGQAERSLAESYPLAEHRSAVTAREPERLLKELDEAIRAGDQARACALATVYGEAGGGAEPVFDLLLRFAISEDGALHAEKYFLTVQEEFAALRPAFRWRQLAGLARVTASEYGRPAPGYAQARDLLRV